MPVNAPAGICPSCLLNAGLELESAATATKGSRFTPPTTEELSSQLPHLDIQEFIGRGGMGAVYKARHLDLDRVVAVKILPAEIENEEAFTERFAREARALAKLNHPNIVSVFDFGQINDQYYFLMEFVDGTNLRSVIDSGNIEPHEALDIVRQLCDALEYAHSQGVVHRDIKPENILVDKSGRIKIADFGLAKLLDESVDESLTATRQVMGSLRYMAPEQTRGTKTVDHRADIFSLGVVFYELLTGDLPIGRFQLPSQKAATDTRLDRIVLRALENEPADRYQKASEVNHDITSLANHPIAAQAPVKSFPAATESNDPRISRKAIFGAVWILFFVVATFVSLALVVMVLTPMQSNYDSSISTDVGPPNSVSTTGILFMLVILLPVVLVGLSSLIGTPLLGVAAVKDIKQSNGQLTGLGLAIFDIVFYPIMLFNLIYIGAIFYACSFSPFGRIALLIGILSVPFIDFLLYRLALKHVKE